MMGGPIFYLGAISHQQAQLFSFTRCPTKGFRNKYYWLNYKFLIDKQESLQVLGEAMAELLKKILIFVLAVTAAIASVKIFHGIISWIELQIGVSVGTGPLVGFVIVLAIVVVLLLISGSASHKEKAPNRDYWEISAKPKGANVDTFNPTNDNARIKEQRILTLSGGGYKAGLFHLGTLQRLNEKGILSKINAFSSVSGGSITLAWLGAYWSELQFEGGVAQNFDEKIFHPLFKFYTEQTLDAPSIAMGLLPLKTASNYLATRFDKRLFKNKTLADFPDPNIADNPCFFINATDLRTNTAWYFTRHPYYGGYAQNWRIGRFQKNFTLGDVVASSAAFPPFFAPMKMALPEPRQTWDWLDALKKKRPKDAEKFTSEAILGDGGIYDNLGLQRALRYRHVMVSNAGDPFGASVKYNSNWYAQLRGTIRHMHRQVEQRRKIHFGDMAALQCVNLMIWEIDDRLDQSIQQKYGGLALEDAWKAATFPVRLKKTDQDQARMIVNHGASLADRETELNKNWDFAKCLKEVEGSVSDEKNTNDDIG